MIQHNRFLHLYLIIINQFLLFFIPTNCDCNHNNDHHHQSQLPNYQLYESNQLPRDVQVTVMVQLDAIKTFFYLSETDQYELSITITTCTSPVRWSVKYQNNSDIFLTNGMDTKYFSVYKGNYSIDMQSLNQTTLVHIYISTELGGPQTLKTSHFQNFKLLPKQKRKRLTIKWHSSLVDPQGTEYCLIINTNFHYSTLCQAQFKLYNISTNNTNELIPARINQKLPMIIACTGRKTQFILTNLRINQTYYFDLFAINHQTNFIYPYGREVYKFVNFKPITLKNDKLLFVNIKEFDNGKIIVRYKINNNNNNNNNRELYLFIIPCGGIIEIEIATKNKTITSLKRIEGFGNVTIYNSNKLSRYYLKIFAMNYEELKKLSGVKVYITNKSPMKIPFPNMPPELNLKEYHLLKTCNSVTIGWFKILSNQSDVNYCLLIREGHLRETDDYIMTNQCNPNRQLVNRKSRKSKSYCLGIKTEKRVIIHKIDNLKPGKNYIVQVTVEKLKGKTLSYNLLQVYTKPYCSDDDYIDNVTNKR